MWGVAQIKDIGTEFVDCLFQLLITKQSEVPQQFKCFLKQTDLYEKYPVYFVIDPPVAPSKVSPGDLSPSSYRKSLLENTLKEQIKKKIL